MNPIKLCFLGIAIAPWLIGTFAILMTGCATVNPNGTPTTSGTFLTNAQAFAWTVANAYEKANTGGVLSQDIASTILKATKSNASTTQEVLIATSLADKVAAAGIAAHNAGATPSGIQAAQTAILSDPGVIATVSSTTGS